MSYRRVLLSILFLTGSFSPLFSVEKWRIAVADLNLISQKDDYNISEILKKSVSTQLKEVKDFEILDLEKGFKKINDRADALQQGRLAEADVIIYGSYYVQKDQMIFFIEILDVLHDQIKFRDYYTGDLSLDLFDTIDELTLKIVASVRAALPEFSVESEVEIKKIRQTVYESQELKLKRMFYTHLGLVQEMGEKHISYTNADSMTNIYDYSGQFPSTQLELGLTVRFGNIRLDGSFTGLFGVPGYYSFLTENKLRSLPSPGFGRFSVTWYPQFLNDKYALGVGLNSFTPFIGTNEHDSGLEMDKLRNTPTALTLFFFTHAIKNLELEASIRIPFDRHDPETISTNDYPNQTWREWQEVTTFWPATTLSVTWFPRGNFGIKARFYYEKGSYYSGEYDMENPVNGIINRKEWNKSGGPMIETLSLYLGLVYKADFL